MSEERERGAASWLVPLVGAAMLFLLGFGVGVVVGAARQEPALVLRHLSGDGEPVELPAGGEGAGPAAPSAPPVESRAPGSAEARPAAAPAAEGAAGRADPAVAVGPPPGPRPLVPAAAAKEGAARVPAAAPALAGAKAPPSGAAGATEPVAGPEAASPAPAPPAVAAAPPAGAAAAGRYSIQVGAFADSAQAKALAKKLEKKGLPVVVSAGTGARDSRWRVRVGPLASRAEADKVARRLGSQEKLPTWILDESR